MRKQVVTLEMALKEAADGLRPTEAVDIVTLPEASLRLRYAARRERSLFQSLRLLETLQRRQDKEPALGEEIGDGPVESGVTTQPTVTGVSDSDTAEDPDAAAPNEANFDASLCDDETSDANLPFPAFLDQVRQRLAGRPGPGGDRGRPCWTGRTKWSESLLFKQNRRVPQGAGVRGCAGEGRVAGVPADGRIHHRGAEDTRDDTEHLLCENSVFSVTLW